MKFSLDLIEPDNYLVVTVEGDASLTDLIAVMDAMAEDGKFPTPTRLWDLRRCSINLTGDQLRTLAEIGKSRDAGAGKAALLVADALNFGLSRLHSAYRESESHEVRVFEDEGAALDWLLGSDATN